MPDIQSCCRPSEPCVTGPYRGPWHFKIEKISLTACVTEFTGNTGDQRGVSSSNESGGPWDQSEDRKFERAEIG